jgi:hypothetical protein
VSRSYYPYALVVLKVVLDGFGGEDRTVEVFARPMKATLKRNAYNTADTFHLEIDAAKLPIAPKQIKGGQAELHFLGGTSLVEDLHPGVPPVMVGLFDEDEISYSDQGRVVTIDGRDLTALYSDREWSRKGKGAVVRRYPSGKRLDLILLDLIAEVDKTGIMQLVTPGLDRKTLPIVGQHATKTNKKGVPATEKHTFWDVMYDTAIDHGFILFVNGLDVVLTTPHDLAADRKTLIRKVAWGKNLEKLSMKRNLGKERVPQIRIRCWDPGAKTTLEGWFPEKADQVTVGVGTKEDEYKQYTVHGFTSEVQLRAIAKTRYNLLAISEQEVTFSTKDLTDLEDVNLLDVAAGDAVAIHFDPFNDEDMRRLDAPSRVQYLLDHEVVTSEAVAQTIADNYDAIDLLKGPYRVKEATLEFAIDQGISIECTAEEFVNVDEALDAV